MPFGWPGCCCPPSVPVPLASKCFILFEDGLGDVYTQQPEVSVVTVEDGHPGPINRIELLLFGGTVTSGPYEFPGGRRFELSDPSGNVLGVWATT